MPYHLSSPTTWPTIQMTQFLIKSVAFSCSTILQIESRSFSTQNFSIPPTLYYRLTMTNSCEGLIWGFSRHTMNHGVTHQQNVQSWVSLVSQQIFLDSAAIWKSLSKTHLNM